MKKEARDKILFTDSFEKIEKFIADYKPPKAREYHGEQKKESYKLVIEM